MRYLSILVLCGICFSTAVSTSQCIDYSSYIHQDRSITLDESVYFSPYQIEFAGRRLVMLDQIMGISIIDTETENEEPAIQDFLAIYVPTAFHIQGDVLYVSSVDGLTMFDISTEGSTPQLGFLPVDGVAYHIFVNGNHAYVSQGEPRRMLVVDVENPADPHVVSIIDDLFCRRFVRHEDILYTLNDGVQILDISDEENPIVLGSWPGVANGHYPGDLAYSNQHLFLASSPDDLVVLDVSDPTAPVEVAKWNGDYNIDGLSVEVVGQTLLLSRDYQSIVTFDISTPSAPIYTGELATQRAYDFAVRDDEVFLAIYDNEIPVYSLGNHSFMSSFKKYSVEEGIEEVVDLAAGQHVVLGTPSRLLVVDHENWQQATEVAEVELPGELTELVVSGSLVLATMIDQGLWAWDLSDPALPMALGAVPEILEANQLSAFGRTTYVTGGDGQLWALDCSGTGLPRVMSQVSLPFEPSGIVCDDARVCLVSYQNMQVVDVSDPYNLDLGPVISHQWYPMSYDLDLKGDWLYLTEIWTTGVFDLSQPQIPFVSYIYPSGEGLVFDSPWVYSWISAGGIRVLEEVDSLHWSEQGRFDFTATGHRSLALSGDHVIAGTEDGYLVAPKHCTGLSSVDNPPNSQNFPSHLEPRLTGCFPNPFNPRVQISFYLPQAQSARVLVYDVAGRVVKVLAQTDFGAGEHSLDWDGQDSRSRPLPSGTYFARLVTSEATSTQKISLIR